MSSSCRGKLLSCLAFNPALVASSLGNDDERDASTAGIDFPIRPCSQPSSAPVIIIFLNSNGYIAWTRLGNPSLSFSLWRSGEETSKRRTRFPFLYDFRICIGLIIDSTFPLPIISPNNDIPTRSGLNFVRSSEWGRERERGEGGNLGIPVRCTRHRLRLPSTNGRVGRVTLLNRSHPLVVAILSGDILSWGRSLGFNDGQAEKVW